jgi:hypothetical protein
MRNLVGGDLAVQEKREEITAGQAFERRNSLIGCDVIRTLYDGRNIEYNNLTNIESDMGASDENGRIIQQYRFTFMNGDMPSFTPNEQLTFIFNNNSNNNNIVDGRIETDDNNSPLQLAGRRKRKTHKRKTHKRKTHKRKTHKRKSHRRSRNRDK